MAAWYLLCSMADETFRADEMWREGFLQQHGFSCGHYDFSYFPDPVVIDEMGMDISLGSIGGVILDYARDDLLQALSPEIEEHFVFGTIIHVSQGEVANFKTLWSPHRVQIRGGKESDCWRCDQCGQLIYYPRGRWYVLSSDLIGALIFRGWIGLIVNEELYQRLKGRRWKKLDISKLTVLDKPRDGFPADLSTITPDQERTWTPSPY